MQGIQPGCLPTIIGSMPHTDPASACALINRFLKDIPCWPQLPQRSSLENMYMYIQFSEGLPGAVISDDHLSIDAYAPSADKETEKLYQSYLDNDINSYPVSLEYAAGLHAFLQQTNLSPLAVKGQITGPVSFGLTVSDRDGKPIIYDDVLSDLGVKILRLKAAWQEHELAGLSRNTIIFLDEPYMASFGSAYVSLSREKVLSLLQEVLSVIVNLKGVHCCGNTDWSLLLASSIDILSVDAYSYGASLSLYPSEVKSFIGRGGVIAWGIVPNTSELLQKETVASLKDRLEETIAPFTRNGIPFRQLIAQSLITPCCGLATLSEAAASDALEKLSALSSRLRSIYL
ncbi:MAG: methionine synthase [Chloroflexota bacterium]